MINRVSLAVSAALASSLIPNAAIANVTDLSVESHSDRLLVTAHQVRSVELFEYRLKYTTTDSNKMVITPWQTSNQFAVSANHGALYDITLEAKSLATGEVASFTEERVSLSSTKRISTSSSKAAIQLSAKADSLAAENNWQNDFVVDIDAFPLINITSDLTFDNKPFDGTPENLPLLTASDIEVREDGRFENVTRFVQPDPNSSRKIVDIVFVHDDSGSLNDEAASVRANILNFVQGLSDENFDYRIGLVPYGGGGRYSSFSDSNGTLINNGSLTSDPAEFQSYIDQMQFDGSREQAFDAMHLAANSILWRPSTQKVVVLVTDENNDSGAISEADVIQSLTSNNILFYGLTAGHDEFDRIAAATSGRVFNVRSDFSSILSEIGSDLSSRYQTQFETDNSNLDGVERVVNFSIAANNYDGSPVEGQFELRYTPQVPVSMELTPGTQALLESGQLPSKSLPVRVAVGSEVTISEMNLGYRHSSSTGYDLVAMSKSADGSWYAEIPESAVQQGSVNFYISASTNVGVKTLPASDPQAAPFIITVFPNVPPEFQHTPVEIAQEGSDIVIEALAEDATNEVSTITLYYRQIGAPLYTEISQTFNTPQAQFSSTIAGVDVTSQGVEYYIVATDDFGSESVSGSPEKPHQISVGSDELPAACNNYANVTVCADDFVTFESSNEILASGNVQIGTVSGNSVLGFSGAVTIDSTTSEVRSIGLGRITALDMMVGYASASDIPLGKMSFSIDSNLSSPELSPLTVFDFSLNGLLLSGNKIIIEDAGVKVASAMELPLLQDYADPSEETVNPIELGDFELSQVSGQSSLEITLIMEDLLGNDPKRRVGKFGNSGLSFELQTLTLDVLSPAISFAGAANWDQKQYGLGVGVGLNPIGVNSVGFTYKNRKRSTFAVASKIPIGTTGFAIAHSSTSIQWDRLPNAVVSGSVSGYFSDIAGGMAFAGESIGSDLLSGSLGLTIGNFGRTWTASGSLTLLEQFPLLSTELTAGLLSSGQYGTNITGNIDIADFIIGTALFNAQSGNKFTQLRSKSDLTVQLPRKIPFVGGTRLAGNNAEMLIRTDHTNGNSLTAYFQSLVKLGSIDLGVRVDFSDPKDVDFSLVKKSNSAESVASIAGQTTANEELTFSIPSGEKAVLFGAITESGIPEIELVLPSGDTLKAIDMMIDLGDAGNDALSEFAYTNGDNQTVIGLLLPEAGDYTFRIVNSADLTDLDTSVVIPPVLHEAKLSNVPATLAVGDDLVFDLDLLNIDSAATAEIQIRDAAQTIEITLDEVAVVAGTNSISVALPTNINSDEFSVVAIVRHDNVTVEAVSTDTLVVENTSSPASPTNLSASFGNGNAVVSWDKSTSSDVDSYFIKVINESRDTSSVVAVSGALDSFELENLTNGDNYAISIAASFENDLRSRYVGNAYGSPTGAFVSGFSDLGFESGSVALTSDTALRGEPIKIAASIVNSGVFTAYSSRFNCYYGTVSDDTLVSSTLIGNLDPTDKLDVSCDIDQSLFSEVGTEVFLTITDVQLPDAKFANNHAVAENPFSRNIGPVGIADDLTVNEDTPLELPLVANDIDDNGDALSIESYTQPSFGTVEAVNGVVTYIPNSNYYGMDTFTYVVTDGELLSEETLVTVDILPVNDAPTIDPISAIDVSEGKSATLTAQASDVDSDTISYSWVQSSGPEVVISGETSNTFTIDAPYVSEESKLTFVLSVSDGDLTTDTLVEVTVLNDNNAPELTLEGPASVDEGDAVDVIATYSDADNDDLTIEWTQTSGTQVDMTQIEGATLSFMAPQVTANETLSFEVSVADGEHKTTQSVSVLVRNVEPTPPAPSKSSGGSMGLWFGALGGLALFRRRFYKK